ncbi:MAG: MoaD/ThiS family protein [Desulfobacteraceae bacterium]|nr:MoaD/ThiS family protein [Desulfobacteraceae bacterium]
MIKINVQLFGTLQDHFSFYDPEKGLSVRIKKGATIEDLNKRLNITEAQSVVVVVDGRIIKPGEALPDNALVKVFQMAHGG